MVELEPTLDMVDVGIEKIKPQMVRNEKEIAIRVAWLQRLKDKAAENGVIIHIEATIEPFETPILMVHPEGDIFCTGKKIFPDCGYSDLKDLVERNALLKRAFAGMKALRDIYTIVRCE